MIRLYLKPNRERPVLNGHPWIFSGAVERVEGDSEAAGVADVFDCKQSWIARGLYNPKSQIRVRLLTWREETIDRDFFSRRIAQAFTLRQDFLSTTTNAYRLINGEGDFRTVVIVHPFEWLPRQEFPEWEAASRFDRLARLLWGRDGACSPRA